MKSSSCLALPGLAAAFLVATVATVATPAQATPNFPPAIQQILGLNAAPPCTICHQTDLGGKGTVTTKFGQTMRSRGLVEEDEESLKRALSALDAERKDSDGDGVPDITELRAGTDPNNPPGTSDSVPTYGCGAQVSPGRPAGVAPDAGTISVVALTAALSIWLRRRSRSRMAAADGATTRT